MPMCTYVHVRIVVAHMHNIGMAETLAYLFVIDRFVKLTIIPLNNTPYVVFKLTISLEFV